MIKKYINDIIFKKRIPYRFPKQETIVRLENVFVFDLDRHNNQEIAEAYPAEL